MNYILIVPCISKIFKSVLLFEIRKYDVQEDKTSYNLFVHSGLDFIPTYDIEKRERVLSNKNTCTKKHNISILYTKGIVQLLSNYELLYWNVILMDVNCGFYYRKLNVVNTLGAFGKRICTNFNLKTKLINV